jgi:hypothetical protein
MDELRVDERGAGYEREMEAIACVKEVSDTRTRSGTIRYTLTTTDGDAYTTFKPEIASEAKQFEGARVRIQYHETQRGQYRNVYLDRVEPLDGSADPDEEHTIEEAAWETALEAAPWLVGGANPPRRKVPPRELFERLKPFKDMVAEDIKDAPDED